MDPLSLLERHHLPGTLAHHVLLRHGREVAGLATAVAERLSRTTPVDIALVSEAAWLHDIGIGLTLTPRLGCHGTAPYIAHGVLGAELRQQLLWLLSAVRREDARFLTDVTLMLSGTAAGAEPDVAALQEEIGALMSKYRST